MPRQTRAVAVTAGAVAVAALLTACDKPTPKVTVLSNRTVTVVEPQTYCFDSNPKHCRINTGTVEAVRAKAGSALLIDVPPSVASKTWSVTSATQQAGGQFTTIPGNGVSSGAVRDSHSTRVTVPFGIGTYFLIVLQQSGPKTTGTWVTRVTITH